MRGCMKVVKRPNYDTQLGYFIFINRYMRNVCDRPSRRRGSRPLKCGRRENISLREGQAFREASRGEFSVARANVVLTYIMKVRD